MNKEETLRNILHELDWMDILRNAVNRRKTSWNFAGLGHPVIEWRNASDEVCMAVINALENKQILEDMYSKVEKIRRSYKTGNLKEKK